MHTRKQRYRASRQRTLTRGAGEILLGTTHAFAAVFP